jgi:hypothetical protein
MGKCVPAPPLSFGDGSAARPASHRLLVGHTVVGDAMLPDQVSYGVSIHNWRMVHRCFAFLLRNVQLVRGP